MSSHIFKIEDGVLALSLVDTAAVGYDPSWQAPGGVEVDTVTLADYATATGLDMSCQITSGALTASPNTNTDTTPATFCGPEVTTTTVGVTSYSLDVSLLPDEDVAAGVSAFLFEHDTKLVYFYLALDGDAAPPAAIGQARCVAAQIGGDPRVTRTVSVSLPVERKPDIWFGNATTNRVVKGDGSPPVAAAASSTPEPEPQA